MIHSRSDPGVIAVCQPHGESAQPLGQVTPNHCVPLSGGMVAAAIEIGADKAGLEPEGR